MYGQFNFENCHIIVIFKNKIFQINQTIVALTASRIKF